MTAAIPTHRHLSTRRGPGIPPMAARDVSCTGDQAETFWPVTYTDTTVAAARTICQPCPARAQCLDWAVDNESQGVWAGTTPDQRRALKSARTLRARRATTAEVAA